MKIQQKKLYGNFIKSFNLNYRNPFNLKLYNPRLSLFSHKYIFIINPKITIN